MFDRFSRSWQLMQAALSVLRADKELLLFPIASAVASFFVLLAFALPIVGVFVIDFVTAGKSSVAHGLVYLGALAFYLVQYFVIFFFNTALVGVALMRMDGQNPTFNDGISIAKSRAKSLLGYALIAATVGLILRALQERAGWLARIVLGLLGAGWTLATSLVVPVLAAKDIGPIEAVKESVTLLKKTWGENVIGTVGLGLAFSLFYIAAAVVSAIFLIMLALTKFMPAIVAGVLIVIAVFVGLVLLQSTLAGIYSAALYRYATRGEGSVHFAAGTLQEAYAPKA